MNERIYRAYAGAYGNAYDESEQVGPVTCEACGCRLTEAKGLEGTAWRHFQLAADTDARGDRPPCLEDLHYRDGTVMKVQSLALLADGESATAR
jgi:hypothetical protein